MLWLIQFEDYLYHNPLAFYSTYIHALRFLWFSCLGVLKILRYRNLTFSILEIFKD